MCIVTFKSMTSALKAKSVLEQLYINCKIINLNSKLSKKGCSYGIEFDCINLKITTEHLNKYNVRYSSIITDV